MRAHTHTKAEQPKEKKVYESDLVNKGNQKWYRPIKNKTQIRKQDKNNCQLGNKEKKQQQTNEQGEITG